MNINDMKMLEFFFNEGCDDIRLSKLEIEERMQFITRVFLENILFLKNESTLLLQTVSVSYIEPNDLSQRPTSEINEEEMKVTEEFEDNELSGEIVYDDSYLDDDYFEEPQEILTNDEKQVRLHSLKDNLKLLNDIIYIFCEIFSFHKMELPLEFKDLAGEVRSINQTLKQDSVYHGLDPNIRQLIFKFDGNNLLEISVDSWSFLCDRCECLKQMVSKPYKETPTGRIDFSSLPMKKDDFQLLLRHKTHPDCFFLLIEDENRKLKNLSQLRPLIESLHILKFSWDNIHPNNDARLASHLRSLHKFPSVESKDILQWFYEIASQNIKELPESRKALDESVHHALSNRQSIHPFVLELLLRKNCINPSEKKLLFKFDGNDQLELPTYFWDFLCDRCEVFKQMASSSNLETDGIDFSTLPVKKEDFQLLLCHMAHPDCFFKLIEDQNGDLNELDTLFKSLHWLGFKCDSIHPNNDIRLTKCLHVLGSPIIGDIGGWDIIQLFYAIVSQNLNELPESSRLFKLFSLNTLIYDDEPIHAFAREILPRITDLTIYRENIELSHLKRIREWCPNITKIKIEINSDREAYHDVLGGFKKLVELTICNGNINDIGLHRKFPDLQTLIIDNYL